jgi:hypothetical protein
MPRKGLAQFGTVADDPRKSPLAFGKRVRSESGGGSPQRGRGRQEVRRWAAHSIPVDGQPQRPADQGARASAGVHQRCRRRGHVQAEESPASAPVVSAESTPSRRGGKYDALTRFLISQSGDAELRLRIDEIAAMVGGLPPSSVDPTWWANTQRHSQAKAWLNAGRRVRRDGTAIVFTVVTGLGSSPRARTPRISPVLDGVGALDSVLRRAGYPSTVAAVAKHTVFLDPRTVSQTGGRPLFPVVRDMLRRGTFETLPTGDRVLLDDNTTPTLIFLWAANRGKGPDVQYNHIWADSRNPQLYTALWNLCAGPAFLAKTTDGQNHPEVRAALRYRAYELHGSHPGDQPPSMPAGYQELEWAPMPEPIGDLQSALRARLASWARSRPAIAARAIGWLYSDWKPDPTIGVRAPDGEAP